MRRHLVHVFGLCLYPLADGWKLHRQQQASSRPIRRLAEEETVGHLSRFSQTITHEILC